MLIALPALGTDLFVPALPALARGLEVEVAAAQLTLTTYFFGLAGGQLLWGPLSDRFGRKPVLLSALVLMLRLVARRGLHGFGDGGHRGAAGARASPCRAAR